MGQKVHPYGFRLGVTTEGLSDTIRIATMGDVGPALGHRGLDFAGPSIR